MRNKKMLIIINDSNLHKNENERFFKRKGKRAIGCFLYRFFSRGLIALLLTLSIFDLLYVGNVKGKYIF